MNQPTYSTIIDVRVSHPEYGPNQLFRVAVTYGVRRGSPDRWGSTMDRSHQGDPDEIENLRVDRINGHTPTSADANLPFEHTTLCAAIVQAILDSETEYRLLIDHADEERRAHELDIDDTIPEED